MRSWRGKCEITSHERGYQPVDAAPARVQDYFRVARKEAICDRKLLFPLSALEWCSVSCWGRGRRRCCVRTCLFSMQQQQHMLRQYVRKWLLRQHTRLAMCLRLRERTLNTANHDGWQSGVRFDGRSVVQVW